MGGGGSVMLGIRWKLYALAALAFLAALFGWRKAGINAALDDERTKQKDMDYEHAQDIEDSVSRGRHDAGGVRDYEDRGYRD